MGKGASAWRVFWGLILLVAAVAVTLSAFNIWDFPSLGELNIGWVVLSIFLAAVTISSIPKLNWFGIFLPVAGIATIVTTQTDYLNLNGEQIGAAWVIAVLISLGFSVLFRRKQEKWFFKRGSCKNEGFAEVIDEDDDAEVGVNADFGSVIKRINSDNFKKAVINCSFSGVKVYFDNTKLGKNGKAEIVINASTSGIELYIPKEWTIINNLKPSLSGVEEKNSPKPDEKKVVTLSGNVRLSGIEIIYV
jgi:hypothetical protein